MNYILGVDGGATKTTVQIADISGKAITETVSKPTSSKSVEISEVEENLNAGVLSAIKNLKSPKDIYFISSCFGFAGCNTVADLEIYKKIVFNSKLKSYLIQKKA